jgi:N-acetylglucosamine repressor
MKLKNQLDFINQIRSRGPLSRRDLKTSLKLSWGSISTFSKELIKRGVIRELGPVAAAIGRRPVKLDMNTDRNFFLGLRLGSHLAQSSIVNVKGTMVNEESVSIDPRGTRAELLRRLLKASKQNLMKLGLKNDMLAGIGIASPGAVDFRNGIVYFAPRHPEWKNVHVKEYFEQEMGVPCFVDHTANCFALSEGLFGAGVGKQNFVSILIGTGVSAGIVTNGQIYRGADYHAGEFGHMCIDPKGPTCACGANGCLETFVSSPALVRMAAELSRRRPAAPVRDSHRRVTLDSLLAAAQKGDGIALKVFSTMGAFLGIGTANIVNLFNPECIVIGGSLAPAAQFFLPALRASMKKHAWRSSRQVITMSSLPHGPELGAAALVLQEFFSTSLILGR